MKPILVLAAALLLPAATFAQGSLTPPGAPAPTMKSLDQIEPRTPIDANHTPGGFLAEYIISQPGSYYLTSNIVGVAGKRGIQVEAPNVTIDFGGFSVFGVTGASDAIFCTSTTNDNLVVRNGGIRGWPNIAINHQSSGALFEKLTIASNTRGIVFGNNSIVRDCLVSSNSQSGIYTGGNGNVIYHNVCAGNNTVNNGTQGGIYVFGNQNRIEGNHVTGSGPIGYGIYFLGSQNIVIQNTVIGGSGNNYSSSAGNVAGPTISALGTITNSNPWANFSY